MFRGLGLRPSQIGPSLMERCQSLEKSAKFGEISVKVGDDMNRSTVDYKICILYIYI